MPAAKTPHSITVNGAELEPDLSGALYWPARDTLIVADLHLEKGSGFAVRGVPLPPYDSLATLQALDAALRRRPAGRVICLGDSFHDGDAPARLGDEAADVLRGIMRGRDWVWIAGNHDPEPPDHWGGQVSADLVDGPLVFRHEAIAGPQPGEVSGHFHPKATVKTIIGKRVTGRCFVCDGTRLILPAFGAFTGGLNARDRAIAGLFPKGFQAHFLGQKKIFAITHRRLSPDPEPAWRVAE